MKSKDWVAVAKLFHDTYERLSPKYGYKTREDTKEFDPESPNGMLMVAVCKAVVSAEIDNARSEAEKEIFDSFAYCNCDVMD